MADGLEHYLKAMEDKLSATEIRVGFLEGSAYPDGTSVALVASRNEYGDPANNQPPRPFFRNAIAEHKNEWADTLARGLSRKMDVDTVFEVVGAQMKGDIQASIIALQEPKLSPATIARRRNRAESPNKSTKPLVDTKVMLESVNYEVIKNQKEKQSLWSRVTDWIRGR